MVLLGCRGDLDDEISPAVAVNTSIEVLADDDDDEDVDDNDDDDRTIAPPFRGAEDPADLAVLLVGLLMVALVMRDAGDLADGDVSLSVGDNDDVTASCRKMRSLRRRYHSSV